MLAAGWRCWNCVGKEASKAGMTLPMLFIDSSPWSELFWGFSQGTCEFDDTDKYSWSPFCLSTALMGLCHFQPRAGCSPSWGNAWTAWAWVQREMQSLFTHLPHQGSLRHHKIGVAESCFVLDFVVDNWHEKGLTNPSFPSVCTRLKWKYDVFRSSLRLLN